MRSLRYVTKKKHTGCRLLNKTQTTLPTKQISKQQKLAIFSKGQERTNWKIT